MIFQANDLVINPDKNNEQGMILEVSPEDDRVRVQWEKRKGWRKAKGLLLWGNTLTQASLRTRQRANKIAFDAIEHPPLLPQIVMHTDIDFDRYLEHLKATFEISVDIETKGNILQDDALFPDRGDFRLLQCYIPSIDKVLIWDFGGIPIEGELTLEGTVFQDYELPGLDILIERMENPAVKVFIHNAAFEGGWFYSKFGIRIFNVIDAMILSQIFWAGLFRGMSKAFAGVDGFSPNALKWVVFRLFNITPDKQDQLWDYGFLLGNRQLNYAAMDTILCYRCGTELLARGEEQGLMHVMRAELRGIPAFNDMRWRGFPINRAKVQAYLEHYQSVIDKLEQTWEEEFPGVNPRSSQQAAEALMSRYDMSLLKMSDSTYQMTPSTSYEVVAPYFEEYPIVKTLSDISSVPKGRDYLQGLLDLGVNRFGIDVICGQFKQLADQAVGRSGCASPNLQNVTKLSSTWKAYGLKPVRDVFEVPPGYKLITIDLDAAHLQILRQGSQDPAMVKARKDDIKMHYITSQGILRLYGHDFTLEEIIKIHKLNGKDGKELHPQNELISNIYNLSKTVIYSFINWGGAARLQVTFADQDPPVFLEQDVCKKLIEGTKAAYPVAARYLKWIHDQSNQTSTFIPVWFDKTGNPVHWGIYYPDGYQEGVTHTQKDNLLVPPGAEPNPRYVGTATKVYGMVRSSLDGGRYFVEKLPNKYNGGRWETKVGDTSAATWQRCEASALKEAAGEITEHFHFNKPEWGAWIGNYVHDELDIIVKEEYALECSRYAIGTVIKNMEKYIPDYQSELTPENAEQAITQYWSK